MMRSLALDMAVLGVGLVHSFGDRERLCGLYDARIGGALPMPSAPDGPDMSGLAGKVPAGALRRMPRYVRMALLAALEARDAAQAAGCAFVPERTALVIGTAYGCVQMSIQFMDSILDDGPRLSSPTAFSHAVNNVGTGLLGVQLDIRGPCCTVTQFGLSFAGALDVAAAFLRAGRADHVLVGAVDEVDPRFSACRARRESSEAVETEGAVFFCLGTGGGGCRIGVVPDSGAETANLVMLSGAAPASLPGERNEHLYGRTPLAQALDAVFAWHSLSEGRAATAACLHQDGETARRVCVRLK